jgi:hypothetical protein
MLLRGWSAEAPHQSAELPSAETQLAAAQALGTARGRAVQDVVKQAQSRLLVLQKKGHFFAADIEARAPSGQNQVRLVSFRMPLDQQPQGPDESAPVDPMLRGLPVRERAHGGLSRVRGADVIGSRLLTSADSPSRMYSQLTKRLQRDGWLPFDPPPEAAEKVARPIKSGVFFRENEGLLLVVAPKTGEPGSSAMMTSIRSKRDLTPNP